MTGVTANNLAAVNAQVLAAATGGADTVAELQSLVTAANNAIAKIEAYNNGDGTTPLALTVADYQAAAITGVSDEVEPEIAIAGLTLAAVDHRQRQGQAFAPVAVSELVERRQHIARRQQQQRLARSRSFAEVGIRHGMLAMASYVFGLNLAI